MYNMRCPASRRTLFRGLHNPEHQPNGLGEEHGLGWWHLQEDTVSCASPYAQRADEEPQRRQTMEGHHGWTDAGDHARIGHGNHSNAGT